MISPGIAVFAPFLWTAFGDATRRGEEIFLVNTWVSALVALWIANLLTHAFTFGVFYLAAVQSVDMLVPEGLRATAQGVFASVVFGLSTLRGNVVSGFLYEPLGMAWLYAAAAALASAGTILYWAGMRPPVAAGHIPEGSSR